MVRQSAGQDASAHLSEAWAKTYGHDPDPDDAYDHAIKAVEAVANPLVLPNTPMPTLGTVISSLHQGRAKWRLVLVDQSNQGDIDPVVVMMMRRLWQGHRSRHPGAPPPGRRPSWKPKPRYTSRSCWCSGSPPGR